MTPIIAPRPLAANDERGEFDCGRASMNRWFREHAWRNQLSGATRTTVICENGSARICGYVSLCASEIRRELLVKRDQRNQPDPIPVILLAQLAIDLREQGQGHARSLLQYALKTALRVSREIGAFGVMTHPLDEMARAFYRKHRFEDLPQDPRQAMIIRMVKLEMTGE